MGHRIVAAIGFSIAVLLLSPVFALVLHPLTTWSIHQMPVLGRVTAALASVAPLLVTVVFLAGIWLTALRLWKRALLGLPGFRPGLSKEDWRSLSKSERRAYRALVTRGRTIVTDAGLHRVSPDGTTWYPKVTVTALAPAGIEFYVGGVALLPGAEIEKAVNSIAAAIPGPEPVEVLPQNDVRFAVFILRTRDPFANLAGLEFGDEITDTGTLDDFLGGEDR